MGRHFLSTGILLLFQEDLLNVLILIWLHPIIERITRYLGNIPKLAGLLDYFDLWICGS